MEIARGTGSPSSTEDPDRRESGSGSGGVARSGLGQSSQSHAPIAGGPMLDQSGLNDSHLASTKNLVSSRSLPQTWRLRLCLVLLHS